jgi:hypothetical protein
MLPAAGLAADEKSNGTGGKTVRMGLWAGRSDIYTYVNRLPFAPPNREVPLPGRFAQDGRWENPHVPSLQ